MVMSARSSDLPGVGARVDEVVTSLRRAHADAAVLRVSLRQTLGSVPGLPALEAARPGHRVPPPSVSPRSGSGTPSS